MSKGRRTPPPARVVQVEALLAALPDPDDHQSTGRDAQAALDQALTSARLDERDAALATEVVYGSLRLKQRIEYLLSRFLKDPAKLPHRLKVILLAAAYEILFLSRVPTYASVNWAVDAVRGSVSPNLSGLTNAVLRRVGELGNEVHEKDFYAPGSEEQVLSRFYSCPEWIVRLWLGAYGPDATERLLRAQMAPAALGVSLPLGGDPEADEGAAGALGMHPALLERSGRGFAFPAGTRLAPFVGRTELWRGSFAARQALMELAPDSWPTPVWDACAGRGGKTRVLVELGIPVAASDVHRGRIRALKEELPAVPAAVASAQDGPPGELFADGPPATILLDAPCSGLGVLARRPDTKWRRTSADLTQLVELQRHMLDATASAVPPGGQLVYLTCTLNPDENERQVSAFLERCPDFTERCSFSTPPASRLGEFFFGSVLVRS